MILDTNVLLRALDGDTSAHGQAVRKRIETARASGEPLTVLSATVLEVASVLESARAGEKGRRGRDTGARINEALEGQSRAADHKLLTSALRFVSRPRRHENLALNIKNGKPAGSGPVRIVTAPNGGFVARAGSRELDYSLSTQVDRHLDALGEELERLWR